MYHVEGVVATTPNGGAMSVPQAVSGTCRRWIACDGRDGYPAPACGFVTPRVRRFPDPGRRPLRADSSILPSRKVPSRGSLPRAVDRGLDSRAGMQRRREPPGGQLLVPRALQLENGDAIHGPGSLDFEVSRKATELLEIAAHTV